MDNSRQVKSTKQRVKGNVTGQFEMLPTDLNEYVALKIISPADVYTYFLLLQFDNKELGYAFPSVTKLMELTGSSKVTVLASLKRLEKAGLIEKAKSDKYPNKNIYYVYKPLTASELRKDNVKESQAHDKRTEKLQETAKKDKERLNSYLEEKAENSQQEVKQRSTEKTESNVIPLPLKQKERQETPQETSHYTPINESELAPEELAIMAKISKLNAGY